MKIWTSLANSKPEHQWNIVTDNEVTAHRDVSLTIKMREERGLNTERERWEDETTDTQ